MEALQAILDVLKPDPWLAVALLLFVVSSGAVYKFYAATLSERGPGARRVRKNLEHERTFLREQYFYVLLSIKRTLDEKFGPPRSKTALVESFSFFMKVSAQYSIGTLLLVYLVSGVSPAVFNVFSSALSRSERGSLAICSILGVCFAAVIYLESNRGISAVARSTFFSITPFFLVESMARVFHYDTLTNSLTYWFYIIFFTSFVASFFTAINQSGFVAFAVLISFPFALFSQMFLTMAVATWMGVTQEDFLKHDFWSVVNGMLFSLVMMCILAATSLFPFLIQFLADKFESVGLKSIGKGKFYAIFVCAGFLLSILSCMTRLSNGLVAILLLPSLVLPLMSTVLDWFSFQLAGGILESSIKRQGKYVILSMIGSVVIVSAAATIYLAAFFLFTGLAEWAQPQSTDFKFVDPSLAVELLKSDPENPQVWWIYALMAFNLLPVLANICAATFGLLSWWTPRPLANRYAGYIKRGFRGDYPRLVETSAFLMCRAVLSVSITLVLITLTFLALRYTFPNMLRLVVDGFKFLHKH